MLAQIAILAHMGFPVPAEAADIGLIDALLYYSKSKGTLTAGAFETTIRDFSRVVSAWLQAGAGGRAGVDHRAGRVCAYHRGHPGSTLRERR